MTSIPLLYQNIDKLWKDFVFLCTQQLLRESYRRTVLPNSKNPKFTIWQTSDVEGENLPPLGDTNRDTRQEEGTTNPISEENVSPIPSDLEDFDMFDFFPSREEEEGNQLEDEEEPISPLKHFEHINVDVLLQQFITLFDTEFSTCCSKTIYEKSSPEQQSSPHASINEKLQVYFEQIFQTFQIKSNNSTDPLFSNLQTTITQLIQRRKQFASSSKIFFFQFPSTSYTGTPIECKNFLEKDWNLLFSVLDLISPIDYLIKERSEPNVFVLEPLEKSFVDLIYTERIKDSIAFWKVCTIVNYLGIDPKSYYKQTTRQLFAKERHELFNNAFREVETTSEKVLLHTMHQFIRPTTTTTTTNTAATTRRRGYSEEEEDEEEEEEEDQQSQQSQLLRSPEYQSIVDRRLYCSSIAYPPPPPNATIQNTIIKILFVLCYTMEEHSNTNRILTTYIHSLQRSFQPYLNQLQRFKSPLFKANQLDWTVTSMVEWIAQQLFWILLCNSICDQQLLSSYAKTKCMEHFVNLLSKIVCDRVDDLQA